MLDSLGHFLSSVEGLLALFGLTVIGVLGGLPRVLRAARERIAGRRDARELGEEQKGILERLARQSGVEMGPGGLRGAVDDARRDLHAVIKSRLKEEIEQRLDRLASGTVGLTYRDLLTRPGLAMSVEFASDDDELLFTVGELPDLDGLAARPLLLIGEAGAGKSVACRSLENMWQQVVDHERWLLTLEPVDFSGGGDRAPAVGSRPWVADLIAERLLGADLSPLERHVLGEQLEARLLLIVDGVDEIADELSARDASSFLGSWAMTHAAVVTARASYFEAALADLPVASRFRVASARQPGEGEILAFMDALRVAMGEGSGAPMRSSAAQELRSRETALQELTHNPLLVTMYMSLKGLRPGGRLTVLGVYREFVRQLLVREREAGRTEFATEILVAGLCEFAWLRFGSPGQTANRDMLYRAVARVSEISHPERYRVVDTLERCSVLALRRVGDGDEEGYVASFYHKSFEDYFVARRVEDWLSGVSPDRGEDFFYRIDSPEVTFFVKQAIARIVSDQAHRQTASDRLTALLVQLLEARSKPDAEAGGPGRDSRAVGFAAGQAAYYLGMLGTDDVRVWLDKLTRDEGDFWIRRCGVIGLAFGGMPDPCHRFIDEMSAGLASGEAGLAEKNIAIELGFYGDQPFDPLEATLDCREPSCRRLVARSVDELAIDVEAANWRMILFNLLYLARFRPESRQSFDEAIRERRSDVTAALDELEKDPGKAKFGELAELRRALDDVFKRS
jgi:hypothetical protein